MKLSIVTTLYKSGRHLREFHARASASARRVAGDDFEIVYVNDGSPDGCLDLAVELSRSDCRVTVVDLTRNFGHKPAVMTGLARAKGDHVFLVDCDLEEEPEWLVDFEAELEREGCDLVYGVQRRRKGGWFERTTGQCFYQFHRIVTGVALPQNVTTARLMTRQFLDALLLHEEREFYLESLFYLTGFAQRPLLVTKHGSSVTTYTLARKLTIVVKAITSTSDRPLGMILVLGGVMAAAGLLYLFGILAAGLLGQAVAGWSLILASVWLVGGTIITCLGVVGLYVGKAMLEAKRRPNTVVRRVYGRKND